MTDDLRLARELAASPDVVWHALTDGRAAWWPDMVFDARVGALLIETWDEGGVAGRADGRVTAVDPGRLLAFTWWEDGWRGELGVEIRIDGIDDRSIVTITEHGFDGIVDGPRLRGEHDEGWAWHLAALERACVGSVS